MAASVPQTRRRRRAPPLLEASALQLFLFERDRFLGTEVFAIDHEVLVGRHPTCDVRLDGPTVSREHVLLWVEDGSVWAKDLGSANGVWLDHRRLLGDTPLGPRSALRLGPYLLRPRALVPHARPLVDLAQSEVETRLEAMLGAEATEGTWDLPVDLGEPTPHLRLVQAAVERAREKDAPPIEAPSSRLPSRIERRVRDLDALLTSLDAPPPAQVPWVDDPTRDTEAGLGLDELELSRQLASCLSIPQTRSEVPVEIEIDLDEGTGATALGDLPDEVMGGPTAVDPPGLDEAAPVAPEAPAHTLEVRPRELYPANLVTPSELAVRVRAASARSLPPPPPVFDAVEVVAVLDGRVQDIAVLRDTGQQYILGHPTPQGRTAPHDHHRGLRMVRLHDGGAADLVFPRDVEGWIERGGERVTLTELTEGRRYSCLRLELGDRVELGFGRNPKLRYRLGLRTRPASLARGCANR